ncbi:hypothetical protein M378DRAFT_392328 [Amanita muscaria Koide BX008]|uniref:Uncharacterized protein n=1 Tax=Amanita muscaria (strain Koide BX008) TaxID=946122 RepID=A0A0C2XB30_AMAMK|nr:hypothetical protein M378DRAFT_392328 [Amanita muscaria Koide BX008]
MWKSRECLVCSMTITKRTCSFNAMLSLVYFCLPFILDLAHIFGLLCPAGPDGMVQHRRP